MSKVHGVLVALVSGGLIAGSVQAQNASRIGGSTRVTASMPMGASRESSSVTPRPAKNEKRAIKTNCVSKVDGKCKDPEPARRPNAP